MYSACTVLAICEIFLLLKREAFIAVHRPGKVINTMCSWWDQVSISCKKRKSTKSVRFLYAFELFSSLMARQAALLLFYIYFVS